MNRKQQSDVNEVLRVGRESEVASFLASLVAYFKIACEKTKDRIVVS